MISMNLIKHARQITLAWMTIVLGLRVLNVTQVEAIKIS